MANVIKAICKYDPHFREKLEEHYRKHCPRLAEAEEEFIPYLLYGVPLKKLSLADCMQVILSSVSTTPYYEVSLTCVYGNMPDRVLKWKAEDIARDRFRYLLALKDKLPAPFREVFRR